MATLSLAPVLDLSAASLLRFQLITRRGADLDLDAADVERISSVCLQILLAARQAWALDRFTFRLINISEQCREALHLAHVNAALGVEA